MGHGRKARFLTSLRCIRNDRGGARFGLAARKGGGGDPWTALERDTAALLVAIGAVRGGRKVVLAVVPRYRESTDTWADLLRDLKARGLAAPRLVIGHGHLGIWGALAQVHPEAEEQRCWNHRLSNVLPSCRSDGRPKLAGA